MNFSDWLQLIAQAGADTSRVDQGWLNQQFSSGISPAIVANVIRLGQAPLLPPSNYVSTYPPSRGIFSSGPYFCAHLLLWHGWLIILAAVLAFLFLLSSLILLNAASSSRTRPPDFAAGFVVTSGMFLFSIPGLIAFAAGGALFVVAGCFVKKNIHLFEG